MFKKSLKNRNFYISNNIKEVEKCKIIVVSINFEINYKKKNPFNHIKMFFKKLSSKANCVVSSCPGSEL